MRKTTMPGIPQAGPGLDPQVQALLGPLKEIVEVREGLRGDSLERAVTVGDMIRWGLITSEQASAGRA
jgi:hypothetical protein